MPYKDPEKRREANKRAQKKRRQEKPEAVALAEHLRHQRSLAKRRAKSTARNRAVGKPQRPKGPRARVELVVPASRKWRLFTHPDGVTRLHFSSRKGYDLEEMQIILREFKALRAKG